MLASAWRLWEEQGEVQEEIGMALVPQKPAFPDNTRPWGRPS